MESQEELKATEPVMEQGNAPVPAIEALEAIEAGGPIERTAVWFLLNEYSGRFRASVAGADVVIKEIFSACQAIAEYRPAVWLSEN